MWKPPNCPRETDKPLTRKAREHLPDQRDGDAIHEKARDIAFKMHWNAKLSLIAVMISLILILCFALSCRLFTAFIEWTGH